MIAGCSLLPSSHDASEDTASVSELYAKAKVEMNAENYEKATEYLEKLQSRFPYGIYAQQAQLDLIYVYYKNEDSASAIAAADRFVKFHPNSPAVDYAYYMKGLANFIGDTGVISSMVQKDMSKRDPKSETESFEAFKQLVTRFPSSKYAPDARQRMLYLANNLALHETHVAEYYYRRGAYVAAINRAKEVLLKFSGTPSTEKALIVMVRSYDALGMTQLQKDAERVLDSTYPEWKAKKVVEKRTSWWNFWK